jgi:hypothetical protein
LSSVGDIFWHMDMNLFAKAADFETLCARLVRKAQEATPKKPWHFTEPMPEASLDGPRPRFRVYDRAESLDPGHLGLQDFADFLVNFDASKLSGVSVDVDAVKKAGADLSKAVASKNNASISQALKSIMSLTQSGGGVLYGNAKELLAKVPQAPAKPATPEWLNNYMAKNKSTKAPGWLDQYMSGEQGDEMKDNMQSALNDGPAVKDTLNRPSYLPDLKQD